MYNRILTTLLVFIMIFIFAACNNNDTNSNTSINDIEENSTSGTISKEPSVIDGVYYGNGIQINVPDGYILYDENDKTAWFFERNHYNMLRVNAEQTTKTINDLTEANIKADLSEKEVLISSEKTTIAGTEGLYYVYKVYTDSDTSNVSTQESITNSDENVRNNYYTVHQYSIIYNSKYISIAFSTEGTDITEIVKNVLDSVVIK